MGRAGHTRQLLRQFDAVRGQHVLYSIIYTLSYWHNINKITKLSSAFWFHLEKLLTIFLFAISKTDAHAHCPLPNSIIQYGGGILYGYGYYITWCSYCPLLVIIIVNIQFIFRNFLFHISSNLILFPSYPFALLSLLILCPPFPSNPFPSFPFESFSLLSLLILCPPFPF